MPSGPISDQNGQNGQNIPVRGGEGVLPYLGYTGTCRWIAYGFFGLAVLNRVYNLTCLCPKQGMVLRA